MKQHITVEQLKELNQKQRKKLLEWYDKLEGDEKCISCGIYLTNQPPLLSIGQMIEFLDDEREVVYEDGDVISSNEWHELIECGFINIKDSRKLCNTLWEAVKEAL